MFSKLHIKNFQSHRDTVLEFDPGVNVIVGTSDSGKTAILRSLRWLAWNRPSGNEIRSWWGGKTEVTLETSNGTISRSKDKREEYVIDEGSPLLAFGLSVPEEVTKVLNLSEINLQSQLDSPFLLSNSPGEVAAHFNRVARLDKIDSGLQNIEKDLREKKSDIKYSQAEQDRLEIELERFEGLEKYEIELEVLEGMEDRVKGLRDQRNRLNNLRASYDRVNDRIEHLSPLLELDPLITSIFSIQASMDDQEKARRALVRLAMEFRKLSDKIEQDNMLLELEPSLNKLLKGMELMTVLKRQKRDLTAQVVFLRNVEKEIDENTVLLSLEAPFADLVRKQMELKSMTAPLLVMNKLVSSLKSIKGQLEEENVRYDTLHQRLEKEFPERCPLCGK